MNNPVKDLHYYVSGTRAPLKMGIAPSMVLITGALRVLRRLADSQRTSVILICDVRAIRKQFRHADIAVNWRVIILNVGQGESLFDE